MRILKTSILCCSFVSLVTLVSVVVTGTQPDNSQASCLQFGHNTNWRNSLQLTSDDSISVAWNIKAGEGRSQVVGVGTEIYVTTGTTEQAGDKLKLTNLISAIDATNGNTIWSKQQESLMRDGQENFSDTPVGPQATPVVAGSSLIALSFTGQLICLNRATGEKIWEKQLVEDLGAKPVQFGFSASPVIDVSEPERIYVMAAGQAAGFVCLNVSNGEVIWKSSSPASPSCARKGSASPKACRSTTRPSRT